MNIENEKNAQNKHCKCKQCCVKYHSYLANQSYLVPLENMSTGASSSSAKLNS